MTNDLNLLRTLGWSDELIEAAKRVAADLPDLPSIPAEQVTTQFDFGGTSTSNELDLSRTPPVGATELWIGRK